MNIIIFGGTGTLGKALSKIIKANHLTATIVSRDELKQQNMRKDFPDFDYVLGDVSTNDWRHDIPRKDYHVAFNLAAVKHVDVAEFNVAQCMRVNTIGAMNTANWAKENGLTSYCFSSTDKSCLPINAYGYSKGLAEKYCYSMNEKNSTAFCVYRWANVAGSRGSVMNFFAETLAREGKVYITDRAMTRFWIHIDDVARFMWERKKMRTVDNMPHIPEMKASTVLELARAVADVVGVESYEEVVTGVRPGEKIHECLYSSHEYCLTSDKAEKFTHEELVELVRSSIYA